MNATTVIAASEAKAKFSELLERTRQGEGFAITLHGEEVAKLLPARQRSLSDIQRAISEIKAKRVVLNPPGKPKLRLKDLINEGRP
jgi:prevent-host-death family protein